MALTVGCFVDPEDTAETDQAFDGVYVSCYNNNQGAADETGGDGGEPNYWWRLDNSLGSTCPTPGECYKEQILPVQFCMNDGNPNGFVVDVFGDWVDDPISNYPSIDSEIRAECSRICEELNVYRDGLPPPVCEDMNWSAVGTNLFWKPDAVEQNYNCLLPQNTNGRDVDGSSIPWDLVGGTSSPLLLGCDLDGDCVDWFYPHLGAFIITPGSAGIIAPHTRTAHLFAAEGGGSELKLEVDMSGTGSGVDDTEPLYGMAEYTSLECGQSVCPFYLANLSAYNTTDSWDIRIEVASVRIQKQISNVQIDLVQSTIGVQNMALSKVAFAPGALRLRVELTIDCWNCNTAGNGTYVAVVENVDYVFADYDDGKLTLEHQFAIQSSGTATLAVEVVPGEFPPVAAHDLGTVEACDDRGGLVLDGSRSFSTDPDDDVEFEMWWVDDEPLGHGAVIPVGSHTVSLEVHDSRGAVHRSPDHYVTVVPIGPC